jgi:serine/threonine-protein kinase RsbT
MTTGTVALKDEQDVVRARQAVRGLVADLGFSLVDQTKMVTAASELARNTVIHGKGGAMTTETLDDGARKGLRLVFIDEGPGIADIDEALRDGFTSGSGMGMGLPGSRRLVNDFTIHSVPGEGTRVSITRWK